MTAKETLSNFQQINAIVKQIGQADKALFGFKISYKNGDHITEPFQGMLKESSLAVFNRKA